jgi:hypothetical protein
MDHPPVRLDPVAVPVAFTTAISGSHIYSSHYNLRQALTIVRRGASCARGPGGCRAGTAGRDPRGVSENPVALDLDEAGLAQGLPRPTHRQDEIGEVPFRPVLFRDNDLPTALERAARWLRDTQNWLGEPLDVIAVHLDYDDGQDAIYYELKLLCNEEDLAGAPIALRDQSSERHRSTQV